MIKGIVLLMVIFAAPASADAISAGRCYIITDPDYRALCRAKAHHEPSYCYSIQRQELRAECLAEARL